MNNDKTPIYPDLNNMWAASSTGYSMAIVAHNMGEDQSSQHGAPQADRRPNEGYQKNARGSQ